MIPLKFIGLYVPFRPMITLSRAGDRLRAHIRHDELPMDAAQPGSLPADLSGTAYRRTERDQHEVPAPLAAAAAHRSQAQKAPQAVAAHRPQALTGGAVRCDFAGALDAFEQQPCRRPCRPQRGAPTPLERAYCVQSALIPLNPWVRSDLHRCAQRSCPHYRARFRVLARSAHCASRNKRCLSYGRTLVPTWLFTPIESTEVIDRRIRPASPSHVRARARENTRECFSPPVTS